MGELPDGYFRQVTLTFNPWSSSTWIKKRFFDPPNDEDKLAITTTYRCNEWLSEEDKAYFEEMRKTNPNRFRVAGDGEWGIEGGAVFEDFRDSPDETMCADAGITVEQAKAQRRFTHVIEPFDLNVGEAKSWTIYRSYDFGYSKPFSCAWSAIDYDGTIYRILELYGCTSEPNTGVRWTPDEQARKIREIETTHPWLQGRKILGVADPAIWDASRGESIAETMNRYGVSFTPGDHKRIPGWMQCHYRLQFDRNGYPRFYVFSNCNAFLRTIPMLTYDEAHLEDVDSSQEDHIADEWRYLCMARPIKPIREMPETVHLFDPLNQFKQKRGE